MAYGGAAGGGAAAAAAAAAIANAIKASGAIVSLEPDEFEKIINKIDKPLVVIAPPAFWSSGYKYLTSYKGLFFHCKSTEPLRLPSSVETVMSKKIWIPG